MGLSWSCLLIIPWSLVRIQAGPVFQRRQTHSLYDPRTGRVEGSKRDSDATNATNRQLLDLTETRSGRGGTSVLFEVPRKMICRSLAFPRSWGWAASRLARFMLVFDYGENFCRWHHADRPRCPPSTRPPATGGPLGCPHRRPSGTLSKPGLGGLADRWIRHRRTVGTVATFE